MFGKLVEAQELLVEVRVLAAEDAEEDLLVDDQVEVDQARLGVLPQPVEVGALGDRADGADHLAGHLEELEHLEPAVAGRGRRRRDARVGRGRAGGDGRRAGVEELVDQVGEGVGRQPGAVGPSVANGVTVPPERSACRRRSAGSEVA